MLLQLQLKLATITKVGRQLLHAVAAPVHARQNPLQGAHVCAPLLMKNPLRLAVQSVAEPLLMQVIQLAMTEPQGRHVEPLRVRKRPAAVLQTHPAGAIIKGDMHVMHVLLVHSAQAAKVALHGVQLPLGLRRLPDRHPRQAKGE